MKRFSIVFFAILLLLFNFKNTAVFAEVNTFYSTKQISSLKHEVAETNTSEIINDNKVYAKYAAVTDKDTGRLLYGKSSDTPVPMASTTKIMTLIIALENVDSDFTATTSSYAASMPDVQLNAVKGQQFKMEDLYYSLMLRSHNDVAVIIAENAAYYSLCKEKEFPSLNEDYFDKYDLSFIDNFDYNSEFIRDITKEQSKILVNIFTDLMNKKALDLGCVNTHYITPNGLDATDETGTHKTTAYELCKIMAYCVDSTEFLKITQTKQHTFSDMNKKNTYCVNNANSFMSMYPGIISGKTGFTNDAGYCYVCACKDGDRTFIVSLLACGWPNNKTYKWKDSKYLLDNIRQNYVKKTLFSDDNIYEFQIEVENGNKTYTKVHFSKQIDELVSENDDVRIELDIPDKVEAPIIKGSICTTVKIYINDFCIYEYPVRYEETVSSHSFSDYFNKTIQKFLFLIDYN